jgi:hypothetical protein
MRPSVCLWVAGEGGWPERVAKTLYLIGVHLISVYLTRRVLH